VRSVIPSGLPLPERAGNRWFSGTPDATLAA
jgi:hypothetical protein